MERDFPIGTTIFLTLFHFLSLKNIQCLQERKKPCSIGATILIMRHPSNLDVPSGKEITVITYNPSSSNKLLSYSFSFISLIISFASIT